MSYETRIEGQRFFNVNNWTAICGAIIITLTLAGTIAGICWAAFGRDTVDARIDKKLFTMDVRVGLLEAYIPQIEEALMRNSADHQALMTQAQRIRAEQTYQDLRRGRIRREK